jgi:hypothetical protein
MVLEAEKSDEVAELDTGEEREELGEELGDEEVELPAGGFKEIGRDAEEKAAGMVGRIFIGSLSTVENREMQGNGKKVGKEKVGNVGEVRGEGRWEKGLGS